MSFSLHSVIPKKPYSLLPKLELTMTRLDFFLFFFIFIFAISSSLSLSSNNSQDFYPLQSFKSSSDPFDLLSSWDPSTNPCSGSWLGVSCKGNRVTKLVLEGLNLNGTIQPLSLLSNLGVLSLKNNDFCDSLRLLNLSLWQPHLKLLYLSNNHFSGPFPESIILLRHLHRLDLSKNLLSGAIPSNIGILLPRLLTLRLEQNMLNGEIPSTIGTIEGLVDLNVSYNHLVGEIPKSLSSFPNSSFIGNSGLYEKSRNKKKKKKKKHLILILLLVVVVVVVAVAALASFGVAFLIFKKRRGTKENRGREDGNARENGKEENLVFFEGCREFVLADLMRASAEMLGKGAVGSTYHVVMKGNGGGGVVVKRVRKERLGKERREWIEVERSLREIGQWRNPNVVSLLACYSSEEELLLVFQYVPGGSLHNLLHGNRGPGRTPLDWTARFKIALGAAKGLSFLHEASKSKLSHYHLTSSNILIGEDGDALISDFALHQLLTPPGISRKNTVKCDVYSFGVVLLEILTGRTRGEGEMDLAGWVQMVVKEEWSKEVFDLELLRCKEMEDEMVALLQIALLCLGHDPRRRPKMSAVHKMIGDIKERGCKRVRVSRSTSFSGNSNESSSDL